MGVMGSSNQNILQKNPSWFEVASLLLLLLLLSFILNSLSPCSHTLPRTCGHFFILLMFVFELMIYSHGKGTVLVVQFCLIFQCCLKPSNQNPRCNSTVILHYFFPSSLIPPFLLLVVIIIVIISAYIHLCRHCCCFGPIMVFIVTVGVYRKNKSLLPFQTKSLFIIIWSFISGLQNKSLSISISTANTDRPGFL